ncbi:MAG: aminotransferase class I/II-fold pyridoxal phosphate-dependent enzyme [Alphaproteobacteria bacterium]|nr:aminotransferase class I/II-fold pyridoxal phosphate-dependent enzyme [Alphaproteobacteria bacterium]
MLNPRFDALRDHPFRRLNELVADIVPRTNEAPILLSVGEPQGQPPALLAETLAKNAHLWNRYPPANGTPELRQAIKAWLIRRYGLPDAMIDADKHIVPVPGTREPLFMLGQTVVPERKNGQVPVVLMPSPLYHIYIGAAISSHAELVFLPATRANGFLPDLDAVDPAVLARTALMYVCSPANPQGTIAPLDYLKKAIKLARQYGFLVAVDECYCEIYDKHAPPGALEACRDLGGGLDHVVVLHSLSKRSSAPGLRSGFIAGDAELMARYFLMVSYGGVPLPLPIAAASAALWNDESHVPPTRAVYRANFDLAEKHLGKCPGFFRPEAGMFLWLDVGDGPATAKRLWAEAGIKTLPGAYMARADANGVNPGGPYLRVALVYDSATTDMALQRMARVL